MDRTLHLRRTSSDVPTPVTHQLRDKRCDDAETEQACRARATQACLAATAPLPHRAGGSAPPSRRFPAVPVDPGVPVSFGGSVGIFHPGPAAVGVLMLSPFGYEEMCCRTTWRSLAETIAAAGLPCLRFDLPGVGDALDPEAEPEEIEDWRQATLDAAAVLRAASGVDRIILLGQSLGAPLAAAVAGQVGPVDAIAYLAPVVDGRRHLRELGMWGRMITDRIGIPPDPEDASGCAVAGFALSRRRAAAVRGIDLLGPGTVPALPSLVVARPERAGDARLAEHIAGLGAPVTTIPYEGHEKLTADPSVAEPPAVTMTAVAAWLADRAARWPAPRRRAVGTPPIRPLAGSGFSEGPLRFGPGGRLFGVLCRPARPAAGRAVVFVGSGRDYHVGLGRATVLQARAFAARGVASLRFDPGGIGDSPPASPDAGEVLYSASQIEDVRRAIDLLETSGFASVALVGRCSGAHAAFHAAARDGRVDRLVLLNLSRFVWDPDEDVSESLRYGHRRLGDFGAALGSRDGLRRLLTGRLRVGAAGRHLLRRGVTGAGLRLAPLLGGLTRSGRALREVRRGMSGLSRRRVPVSLVYSDGDSGLDELDRYFGRGGRGLRAYPNVSMEVIADADHNFTHLGARDRLVDALSRALSL